MTSGATNHVGFWRKSGSIGLILAVIGSILIRWCVSLGNYSGEKKSPLYGDYEAQRHWQEITLNLPVTEWYINSTKNDLMYWGLDYPPLTAYHSLLCGYIASKINPAWVELTTSRGFESYDHKLFMRYTVLAVDLMVLFPAIILLWNRDYQKKRKPKSFVMLLLMLFYPGLMLIDHGHFQYNNFSLGLFLWSFLAFSKNKHIFGSIFFCLALNYKQMELYHALPVFFFLLGRAFSQSWWQSVKMIGKLAATVFFCFTFLWLPYTQNVESALQVLSRLFPLGRGLYEDKVANVWCTLAPILKLKLLMEQHQLVQLCGLTTLLLSLPSCLYLLKKPTLRNFKFSLVNVSLVFFLFSYQVHEKSILIPAFSACLLYGEVPTSLIVWFLHFSVISMSPLLLKDGLILQQVATSVLFLIVTSQLAKQDENKDARKQFPILFWISVVLSAALVFLPFHFNPPARYPDLWAVLVSSVSCAAFLLVGLVLHYMQFDTTKDKVKKS